MRSRAGLFSQRLWPYAERHAAEWWRLGPSPTDGRSLLNTPDKYYTIE
jgi:hypothetical protein